jgi:hypothetical protein
VTTFGFRYLEGPVDVFNYPEDTTGDTFKVGDPVYLVAGKVRIAASDQAIFGIAMQDAKADDLGALVRVARIHPDQIWCAVANNTTTQAMEGIKYGLNISAGNGTIDVADTTTVTVIVMQLDPSDGPVSSGKMWVRFLRAVCDVYGN